MKGSTESVELDALLAALSGINARRDSLGWNQRRSGHWLPDSFERWSLNGRSVSRHRHDVATLDIGFEE
ncbi:MAG: hypothetical protein ACT4P6_03905 [Gemmatimonadaceae bacterium]